MRTGPTTTGVGGFGNMVVIATDQFTGRLYRCPCGWEGWTVWGRARKHALECESAAGLPDVLEPGRPAHG